MLAAPQPSQPRTLGQNVANYGSGLAVVSLQEMMRIDPDVLGRQLVALFESPKYQPPVLPAAAAQILKLSSDPTVELGDIVEVLGTDPLLMGRVVAVAQSSVYGDGRKVTTLQYAVARLGIRGLRNIVMEAALEMRVFRTSSYADCMESVRKHSLVTAHFSHLVARRVRVDPNEAFLAGLLHDVGLAGGLLALSDGRRKDKVPPLSRFWPSIEHAHDVGGAAMLRMWGVSDELATAASWVHQPFGPMGLRNADLHVHPLTGCVALADQMAQRLGARIHVETDSRETTGTRAPDTTGSALLLAVRDAFKLTPAETLELDGAARELYPLIG